MIHVEEYLRQDGSSPFRDWFERLDPAAAAKVATAQMRVGLGITSSIKWFDGIGEIRIHYGPGYRVYLARDGNALIVLFGGGTKATQKKDIEKAKVLHLEYKVRKRAAH